VPAAGGEPESRALERPAVFLPLLLVLTAVVSSFYVDRSLPNPDEGAVLTNAAKILRGGVFYRDIDAYPFPGSYYLLALVMGVFGEHLSVARWLAAAVFGGVVTCLYLTALQLVGRRNAALFGLSLLSLKFFAWPGFSSYLYSDVGFLGGCASIALFVRHRTTGASWQLAAAGLSAGIALAAKQNIGLYLGAAAGVGLLFPRALGVGQDSTWRRRFEDVLTYGAGAAAALVPMLAYFAFHGVLGPMLYSGFVRPFTGYLPTSGIDFWPMLAWWELGSVTGREASPYFVADYWHLLMQEQLPFAGAYPLYWLAGETFGRLVYTSLPAAFGWFAWRWWRGRRAGPEEEALRAFGLLAIPVVLTAFPRADSFHLFSVYALVLLLLLALARPAGARAPGPSRVGPLLAAAAVALVLGLTGTLAHLRHVHLTHVLKLARAEVRVAPDDAWVEPVVAFVERNVPPGEALFVYGHEAHLYFLTGRFFPWSFPQLYPGQEGGDEGGQLVALLRETRPRVVLRGVLRWPGVPVLPDYAPALDDYLREHFERDRRFFDRELPAGRAPPEWVMTVLRPRGS